MQSSRVPTERTPVELQFTCPLGSEENSTSGAGTLFLQEIVPGYCNTRKRVVQIGYFCSRKQPRKRVFEKVSENPASK
ncbi:hypothetical protein SRHO_G00136130 [Serrasalmus rhombeus]